MGGTNELSLNSAGSNNNIRTGGEYIHTRTVEPLNIVEFLGHENYFVTQIHVVYYRITIEVVTS